MKLRKFGLLVVSLIICVFLLDKLLQTDKVILSENQHTKEETQAIGFLTSYMCKEYSANPIVYDGMTLQELGKKLNASLNSNLKNKGDLIASYSLEVGVDPYLVTAIILVETGCKWECSSVVKRCNNVGGQVGSGCGKYKKYKTLDDGIRGLIDYLYSKYISKGLVTPKQINTKYAENKKWYQSVNKYIESIKAQ